MSPAVVHGMRNTDAPTKLASAIAVIAMTASTVLTPSLGGAATLGEEEQRVAQQSNTGAWLDTSNRQAVIDNFNTVYSAPTPDMGWTGNHDTCDTGTINPAYRAATIDRVNWYRAMAGVPAVTENPAYSASAQTGTLLAGFSSPLTHYPTASATCYTAAGAEAVARSNLSRGSAGPDAIDSYMIDFGATNASVDHRNWILSPTAQQFGVGNSPKNGIPAANGGARSANVLYVIEPESVVFGDSPTLRETDGFVAWPNSGYTPAATVYERWSFSLRGANFTNATVTTQQWGNGTWATIPSNTIHQSFPTDANNLEVAPFGAIVWEPQLGFPTEDNTNRKLPIPTPDFDQTYRVTVDNVQINGSARSFVYDVTVIGDQPAPRPPAAVAPDTDTQIATSPDAAFVNAAFNDFLDRDATPTEIQTWSASFAAGTDPGVFVNDLTQRDEWITTVVDRMYKDTLGRDGDPGGRAYWIDRIQNHGLTVADMAALFYSSPEYLANEGNSIERWIDDLYIELLQRPADSQGRAFWVSEAAKTSVVDVARRFYQSDESRRTRVQNLYQELLGRSTDPGGETFWAERLLDGNDLALAADIAASDEYRGRAGK